MTPSLSTTQIGLTAMGLKVQRYATAETYEAELGAYPAAFESEGAEIVSSGSGATRIP